MNKYHLNYNWQYSTNYQEEEPKWTSVNIPHTNIELPYNYLDEKSYQFKSCYKKEFRLPAELVNKPLLLHFDGVMLQADIYINDQFVGNHKGGYSHFSFDISSYLKYLETNTLEVFVDSREDRLIPPFGFVVDFLTYGGIYREVYIEVVDDLYIEHCHIITANVLSAQKQVSLDLFLCNYNQFKNASLRVNLLKAQTLINSWNFKLELAKTTSQRIIQQFEVVDNILLWDLDNPQLYDFELILTTDVSSYQRTIRTGFREVEVTESGFYLNNQKIKLCGLNRHQSFPYVGYAMPKNAQVQDADILKYELGVNVVRSSHYPPSKHFLNRCDEIGLLVFDEIPGWQYVSEKQGEWSELVLASVEEMIKNDFNHPSIFIWGVRINESKDNDWLYTQTNDLARNLDCSRPTGGVRCIKNSNLLEDVYTYNDFIHNGDNRPLDKKSNVYKGKLPYLITEYNGHMYPTKRFDPPARRIEHSLRHLRVINKMYGDKEVIGAIGWCMNDYNTHQEFGSGDKICYHGVLDMYRNFKYAGYVYQVQNCAKPKMEVLSTLDNGDLDGSVRGDIYIVTNCQLIKMYINDQYIKDFYPRKDVFTHLPHPPIIIDDYIGDRILKSEKFSPKDAVVVKRILAKVDKSGLILSPLDMFHAARVMMKYKVSFHHFHDIYNKYFSGWGSKSTIYRFDGYVDDKCVLSKTKSQVFIPKLVLDVDDQSVTFDETYQTLRCSVKCVDENSEICVYASEVIEVLTTENLELIGPNCLSLIGGVISFWVKTTRQTGDGEIIVNSPRFGCLKQSVRIYHQKTNQL